MPIRLTPFDRPEETIQWATEAIEELEALYTDFLVDGMSVVVEPHDKPQYKCLKVKALKPFPSAIRRRATEALNNIRHSFDQSLHAACIVLREPRPNTNFPWRESPIDVERYLSAKDIPRDLWEVIMREEPYPRSDTHAGGDDFIRAMAKVSNGKHTVGLRVYPRVRHTAQPSMEGQFVLIPAPVWDPVKNEQIMAIGPSDLKLKDEYTIVLNVAFDEPGPLQGQSLGWGLAAFHAKAQKVAKSLEARCIELLGLK